MWKCAKIDKISCFFSNLKKILIQNKNGTWCRYRGSAQNDQNSCKISKMLILSENDWFLMIFDDFWQFWRGPVWSLSARYLSAGSCWNVKRAEIMKKQWKKWQNGQFWNCRNVTFSSEALSRVARHAKNGQNGHFGVLKKTTKKSKKWTRVSSAGKRKIKKCPFVQKNSIFKRVHRPIEAIDLTETRKITKKHPKVSLFDPSEKSEQKLMAKNVPPSLHPVLNFNQIVCFSRKIKVRAREQWLKFDKNSPNFTNFCEILTKIWKFSSFCQWVDQMGIWKMPFWSHLKIDAKSVRVQIKSWKFLIWGQKNIAVGISNFWKVFWMLWKFFKNHKNFTKFYKIF